MTNRYKWVVWYTTETKWHAAGMNERITYHNFDIFSYGVFPLPCKLPLLCLNCSLLLVIFTFLIISCLPGVLGMCCHELTGRRTPKGHRQHVVRGEINGLRSGDTRRQVAATIPFVWHARFNEKSLSLWQNFVAVTGRTNSNWFEFVRHVAATKWHKLSLTPMQYTLGDMSQRPVA